MFFWDVEFLIPEGRNNSIDPIIDGFIDYFGYFRIGDRNMVEECFHVVLVVSSI